MERKGADLGGGGTVPSQGERAGRGPRGPDHCRREVARGIGARGLVGGGRRRGAGHTPSRCSPERSGGRGVRACARGSLPGPRRGRPASVDHPARREAECGGSSKWARGLALGDPGLGTRLRSSSLSAPDPVLLPEPGPSVFLLPLLHPVLDVRGSLALLGCLPTTLTALPLPRHQPPLWSSAY